MQHDEGGNPPFGSPLCESKLKEFGSILKGRSFKWVFHTMEVGNKSTDFLLACLDIVVFIFYHWQITLKMILFIYLFSWICDSQLGFLRDSICKIT